MGGFVIGSELFIDFYLNEGGYMPVSIVGDFIESATGRFVDVSKPALPTPESSTYGFLDLDSSWPGIFPSCYPGFNPG